MEELENEIRAIGKLCVGEVHKNVVTVFQHGNLPKSHYYFFDMELCNFNLENYLQRLWEPTNDETMSVKSQSRAIIRWSTRMNSVLNIMSQIACGLEYIHGHNEIHRDLKPRNSILPIVSSIDRSTVLFSEKEAVWKISDFGISAEGSTSMARTTRYSR